MEKESWKKHKEEEMYHNLVFGKWMVLAVIVGLCVGIVGVLFYHALSIVTRFRIAHPNIVYLLPLGGLMIVWLYHRSGVRQSKGTNMVISSIRTDEHVPLKMAPLIFTATVITHLFGGSAGREGAALQIGGSLGYQIGKLCRLDDKDLHIITMCGMSAAFSALFGTPIAAAIFPLEVVSVGIMYYAALVPCALSSIIASSLAAYFGAIGEQFILTQAPALSFILIGKVLLLAILCAWIARIFCLVLHRVSDAFTMFFTNQYIRIVIGAGIIIISFWLFSDTYLGAGMDIIAQCMQGSVIPFAFLLKMLLTAITLGCGFKGGEIVPSFFIGATFGAWIGSLLQMPIPFAGAIGLMSVFCGVTNCPITSLLLSFELFGFISVPYFLLADAIAYMLSGYESLYHEQKIMYSKFSSRFIDKKEKA